MSWWRPESTSQGLPFNVRFGYPLDVISGHPQDDQIESLGDVLGTLAGGRPRDVLGTILAGWEEPCFTFWGKFSTLSQRFFFYWFSDADLGKILHIFAASMGMLQMLPLILENSPFPCIIAIFWNKLLLEIRTFSNFFKFFKSVLLQTAWHGISFL